MAHEPKLYQGDCLEVMRTMAENSVDSIVTDPPYGLAFMGKKWDYDVPTVDVWRECLRVLKPGGYLLAFAGTRTQHRMAVNIEDAGFEIRDMIAWVYGSGFPKSHDISKAIDKAAGAERKVIGINPSSRPNSKKKSGRGFDTHLGQVAAGLQKLTAPATPEAEQWQGWGTALKPAFEPVTVARKPLQGTVAENVLQHGTGGLNIDGSRVGETGGTKKASKPKGKSKGVYGEGLHGNCKIEHLLAGRYPANFIHDGSPEAVTPLLGNQRFFYCAKADQSDRHAGTDKENTHPTVKPLDLMKYLCRLVTQPGGTVLDPFMGSGTTGRACLSEGFGFVGIEKEKDYFVLSQKRMTKVQLPLF